jgi:hypothetical protein
MLRVVNLVNLLLGAQASSPAWVGVEIREGRRAGEDACGPSKIVVVEMKGATKVSRKDLVGG